MGEKERRIPVSSQQPGARPSAQYGQCTESKELPRLTEFMVWSAEKNHARQQQPWERALRQGGVFKWAGKELSWILTSI